MAGSAAKTSLPMPVVVGVLAAAVGVGVGYWSRGFAENQRGAPPSAGAGMMGGSGGRGGGGGGFGGGGGGQQHPNVGTLTRTVRGLSIIELAQGKGLTADQRAKIKPILEEASKADPMTEDQAQKLNDQLQAALNDNQKDALTQVAPARGGGGRGGPPPPPGPGAPSGGRGIMGSGGMGSGGMGSGGMGGGSGGGRMGGGGGGGGFGGGQTDFDHPFKSGTNKENLDRLMGQSG